MADVVDRETRSRMMAGIRGKDTKPELLLRRALHKRGFRYRLHVASLPGKPDMVFPKHYAVIQIHGCFWHCHDCHLFKWPGSRVSFWRTKILRNREKDAETSAALLRAGWRVLTVWECALKGRTRRNTDDVINDVAKWLISGNGNKTVRGTDRVSC